MNNPPLKPNPIKPPHIPFLKTIKNISKIVANPIAVWMDGVKEHGDTFSFHIINSDKIIVTRDAALIQHVLQKNNKNYRKSRAQIDGLGRYLGKGLLTSEGEYWLRQRRLIQPGFHRKKLAKLVDLMVEQVDNHIEKYMEPFAQKEGICDIAEEMTNLTFLAISKSMFSRSVDIEELHKFRDIIDKMQQYVILRIRQPFMIPWYNISGKEKYHKGLKEEGDEFLLKIINERKESQESHDDLLDMLLETRYEDTGEGMTDQQLLDETLVIFTAGHETTANGLSWLWYLLDQNPDVVQKILQELEEVIGDKPLTFSNLMELTYLKQVLNESMRLYPPAWAVDRIAIENDEAAGYKIEKGVTVLSFVYGTHRNPKYWDNPDEFRPERFAKENLKNRPSYAFLPFGGGPRMCIGNNFAIVEMQIIVAKFLKSYKFEVIADQLIEKQPLVTLRAKNGIKVKVKHR